ncbi:MAG: arginine repressor [Clostridia bacterium]|nr:arginine repressor [Clostridia bacterium]
MNKHKRQQKVLEIVSKTEVDTQEELLRILEDQGLKVTQATVSRDVKELGLIKVAGKTKKYCYAKSVIEQSNDVNALIMHFKTAIISVTAAQNLIVIKTLSGNANAVGVLLDGKSITGLLGTIAGDDTLLVITTDSETALSVSAEIKEFFRLQ